MLYESVRTLVPRRTITSDALRNRIHGTDNSSEDMTCRKRGIHDERKKDSDHGRREPERESKETVSVTGEWKTEKEKGGKEGW